MARPCLRAGADHSFHLLGLITALREKARISQVPCVFEQREILSNPHIGWPIYSIAMIQQVALGLKEDDIEPSIEACAATAGVPRRRTLELLAILPTQVWNAKLAAQQVDKICAGEIFCSSPSPSASAAPDPKTTIPPSLSINKVARSAEEEQAIRNEEEPRSLLPVASVKPDREPVILSAASGLTPGSAPRLSSASTSPGDMAESLGLIPTSEILLPSELLLETHNNVILLFPRSERWVAALGQFHVTNYRVVFSGRITRHPGSAVQVSKSMLLGGGSSAEGIGRAQRKQPEYIEVRIKRMNSATVADAIQLGVSPDADEADEVALAAAAGEASDDSEDRAVPSQTETPGTPEDDQVGRREGKYEGWSGGGWGRGEGTAGLWRCGGRQSGGGMHWWEYLSA
jgi:hypothetical protein